MNDFGELHIMGHGIVQFRVGEKDTYLHIEASQWSLSELEELIKLVRNLKLRATAPPSALAGDAGSEKSADVCRACGGEKLYAPVGMIFTCTVCGNSSARPTPAADGTDNAG